jgi:hypothetical protein
MIKSQNLRRQYKNSKINFRHCLKTSRFCPIIDFHFCHLAFAIVNQDGRITNIQGDFEGF